jgi:polyisoprenyl-phosphate glycosyltransferase
LLPHRVRFLIPPPLHATRTARGQRHVAADTHPDIGTGQFSGPAIGAPGKRKLSVVVPMLNEEKGLDTLVERLKPMLDATGLVWEVVFVDDGSKDRTCEILKRLNATDPRLKAVSLSRNFGKELAVAAGLKYATGDAVVLMDADLQHPPEVIPEFIAKWREGYDIVFGRRDDRQEDSLLRRVFSVAFYRAFKAMSGTTLPGGAGDFRLLDRKAVDALNGIRERVRFNKGLYAWIGFKSTGVTFHVPPRYDGTKSRFRPRQLWRFALDGLVSFTTLPLRVWSYVGIAVSTLAFVYILVFLLKYLFYGDSVAGFPTLIISILFLGGIQLISLGVIGEYLGRMYEEVKGRPLFIVGEEIGVSRSDPVTDTRTRTERTGTSS